MVRLGQNFLADRNLLDAIVRDAALDADDVVLEVGGGEGVLTERLAAAARHVHLIELDQRLREHLEPIAEREAGLEIVWGDAMRVDLTALEPAPTVMVANLPYSIATPLLLRTIAELPSLRRWTVMVQREIAERLRARPAPAPTARRASSSSSPATCGCCARSTRPCSRRGRGSTAPCWR